MPLWKVVSLDEKMPKCFAKHEAASTYKEAVLKIKSAASVNIGAILDARMNNNYNDNMHYKSTFHLCITLPGKG